MAFPALAPAQLQKVRDSREIHRSGRALLHAVMCKGGVGVLEQPPTSLTWLETANFELFRRVPRPPCLGGRMPPRQGLGQKAGASQATAPESAALQPYATTTLRTSPWPVSKMPPESASPPPLPSIWPPCPKKSSTLSATESLGIRTVLGSWPWGSLLPQASPSALDLRCATGQATIARQITRYQLNIPCRPKLAHAWLRWAAKGDLDNKIMAHVMRAAPEPPLSPLEVNQAIQILYETIGQPQPSSLEPEAETALPP